jgi:hypothetical protein
MLEPLVGYYSTLQPSGLRVVDPKPFRGRPRRNDERATFGQRGFGGCGKVELGVQPKARTAPVLRLAMLPRPRTLTFRGR